MPISVKFSAYELCMLAIVLPVRVAL